MADLSDITIGIKVEDGDVIRGIKTFERMKRQVADLTLSERKGEISRKAYNRSLQQMAQQLGKVTGNLNNAKSSIQKYAFAVKDATDEQLKFQSVSGKGMRRFELIAQQAGYQFGDLAVQIQSGTNAAVALGQQGSQLLGFFGPYGALAGAGLAIVTGLVAPLLKAKKAAKDVEKAFEGVEDALNKLDSIKLGDNLRGNLLEVAKEVRSEFEASLSIVKEIAAEQLKTELAKPLADLREQYSDFVAKSSTAARLGGSKPEFNLLGFDGEQRFIQTYQILNDIQGDTREELQKSVDAAAMWLRGSGLLTDEVKKLLSSYIDVVGTVEAVSDSVEDAIKVEQTGISETEKLRRDLEQRSAERLEAYYELKRELARKAGRDDLKEEKTGISETEKLRRDLAQRSAQRLEAYYELKRRLARKADEEESLQRQKRIQQELLEIEEAKLTAIGLYYEYLERIEGLVEERRRGVDKIKEAESAANKTLEQRLELAQIELKFGKDSEELAAAVARHAREAFIARVAEQGILGNNLKEILKLYDQVVAAEGKVPKTPKTSTTIGSVDNVAKLQKKIELERALIGKVGEALVAEEARQRVISALGDQYKKTSKSTIKGLEDQIIKTEELKAAEDDRVKKLKAAKDQQEEIANTIAGGFGDAFMSIVDGTKSAKEAFSDMARHIIARLFEILVIEQMVQSIAGGIKMAFGGASGTAVASASVPSVPSGDGGGYTGSGSRSGGLDGRGGFMAMLHPRETIIDHTKPNQAMSQQPVVINQSFNFAANGDDSVKKIIAQEAPKIARMTQQQILDQRRRGGQMKAAFS